MLWYAGQVTNICYISVSGASKLCFLLPQRRFHSIFGYSTCGVFWNKLEVFLKPKNILPEWLVREKTLPIPIIYLFSMVNSYFIFYSQWLQLALVGELGVLLADGQNFYGFLLQAFSEESARSCLNLWIRFNEPLLNMLC